MIIILTKNQVVHHDAGDKLFGYDTSSSCWQVPIFSLFHIHCVFYLFIFVFSFYQYLIFFILLAGPHIPPLSYTLCFSYLFSLSFLYLDIWSSSSCWQVPIFRLSCHIVLFTLIKYLLCHILYILAGKCHTFCPFGPFFSHYLWQVILRTQTK